MNRIIVIVLLALILQGCSSQEETVTLGLKYPDVEYIGDNEIPTFEEIKLPIASNVLTMSDDTVIVDYSNANNGYIMASTKTENHAKLKIRIYNGDDYYTYDINKDNEFISYPLTFSSGKYICKVYENIKDSDYAVLFSFDFDVNLANENDPYLYPSVIVDYDLNSECVNKSFELCKDLTSELERVYVVYSWITKNVDYDWDKVQEVQGKYVLPILDETLDVKKGICFDYAALMTCMLRVQQIPTKVVTGYVDIGYHAWVEVYIEDIGWINPEIYFNSEEWTLIDPTFDAMDQEKYTGPYESTNKY